MNPNDIIRVNIKWLRQQYNFSQQQLADVLAVTRPLVGSWEEGRSTPQYAELISVSDYFRVTIDDLLRVELSRCYVIENVKILAKLTIEK